MRAVVAAMALMLSLGEAASYDGGSSGLSPGYYSKTCSNLEKIVLREVTKKKNETVVTIPAVLRLFFHDCLVNVSSSIHSHPDMLTLHCTPGSFLLDLLNHALKL